MTTQLLKFVSERVAEYPGPMTVLAKDADVPYSWLLMFARGQIDNPGIQQIEKLARHFTSRRRQHTERVSS